MPKSWFQRVIALVGLAILVYGLLAAAGVVSITLHAMTVAAILGVAVPIVHAVVTTEQLPAEVSAIVAAVLTAAAAVLAIAIAAGAGTITLTAVLNAGWPAIAAAGGSYASITKGPVVDTIHQATDGLLPFQLGARPASPQPAAFGSPDHP